MSKSERDQTMMKLRADEITADMTIKIGRNTYTGFEIRTEAVHGGGIQRRGAFTAVAFIADGVEIFYGRGSNKVTVLS